jgi:hypothetical protein
MLHISPRLFKRGRHRGIDRHRRRSLELFMESPRRPRQYETLLKRNRHLPSRLRCKFNPNMAPSRALRRALALLPSSSSLQLRRQFGNITVAAALRRDLTSLAGSGNSKVAPLDGIRVLDMTRVLAGVSGLLPGGHVATSTSFSHTSRYGHLVLIGE